MQNNTVKVSDFVGRLKIIVCISLAVMLTGVVFNIVNGTKLDINFKGGTTITYSYENDLSLDEVQKAAKASLGVDVKATESTDYTSGSTNVVITVVGEKSITQKQMTNLEKDLTKAFPDNNMAQVSFNAVEASVGSGFFAKSLYAMFIASLLVVLYVGVRFRNIGGFSAAVMALVALIHDLFVAYFAYVILGMPLNDNFIAVVLTILGYSLNDTIVIYARVRENTERYQGEKTMREIVNLSISQSFRRTMITSITTFIAITTITVVASLRGLDSILSFSIPMSIGLISGWYSSTMLSGPLWVKWLEFRDKHFPEKKVKKSKKK